MSLPNSQALKNENLKQKFCEQFEKEISMDDNNVETMWTSIKTALTKKKKAEKTLPRKSSTKRD